MAASLRGTELLIFVSGSTKSHKLATAWRQVMAHLLLTCFVTLTLVSARAALTHSSGNDKNRSASLPERLTGDQINVCWGWQPHYVKTIVTETALQTNGFRNPLEAGRKSRDPNLSQFCFGGGIDTLQLDRIYGTNAVPGTGSSQRNGSELTEINNVIERIKNTIGKDYSLNKDLLSAEAVLFEGDIRLTAVEAEFILASTRSRKKRKINAESDKRWPLPIPFRFNDSPKYLLNSTERSHIMAAINEMTSLTCITFKEVNESYQGKPVLDFRKDVGCWSYVGREKAFQFQEISTASGCFEKGILLHELGHAIGFWHEQSRPDRDSYVTYVEENVKRGEEFNFKRESWGDIDNMGVPYDVGSIMHYGSSGVQHKHISSDWPKPEFFSKNGLVTLRTKDPLLQRNLGQRQTLSFFDAKLANLAYCKDSCPTATFSCLHDGYPDPKDCSRCRCPDGLSGSRCQFSAQPVGASCGGPLFVDNGARYTIRSPGFPWAYMGKTQCNWLFQARPGMRLYLDVKPDNFMRHPNCPRSNQSICADYLEVKYNLSFGYTGARFCCGLPPSDVITSSSNTMLVLFRTSQNGIGGFTAELYAEPCGGCFKSPESQKPCHVTQTTSYRQEWYKMEYVPCPVFYRPPTYVCNKYLPRKHSRVSSRELETEECCEGYNLKDGYCIPSDREGMVTPSVVTDGDNSSVPYADTTSIPKVAEAMTMGWSEWSQWSVCTATCGGCGKNTRTKACEDSTLCGGQSSDIETQVCNTHPCPSFQAYACSQTTVEEYNCGWLINCTRSKTEMRQCVTRCCPNYEEKNGVCQPVSSTRKRKRRK